MPELPEVETVRRTLEKKLKNKTILSCEVYWDKIINQNTDDFLQKIKGQKIKSIDRIGKFLIFKFSDMAMISHLRMEGKYFIWPENTVLHKHSLVIFHLDNNKKLVYEDTRRFGRMELMPINEIENYPAFQKMGPEPMSDNATGEYLYEKLQKKSIAIKSALLDQNIIAGLGNIYVNEVLFLAKINPERRANEVSLKECETIIKYAAKVLTKATELGGSSINTYANGDEKGSYQEHLKVHTKKDEPCPGCKGTIQKIKVNGRGTYYCPKCQK